MPVLSINKPLEQGSPLLLVENRLAIGRHRFSLVVTDNDGQESDAAVFTLIVRDPRLTQPPVVGPVTGPVVPGPIVRPPLPGPVIDPVGPVIGPVVRPPVAPVVTPVIAPVITPLRPRRPRGPTR